MTNIICVSDDEVKRFCEDLEDKFIEKDKEFNFIFIDLSPKILLIIDELNLYPMVITCIITEYLLLIIDVKCISIQQNVEYPILNVDIEIKNDKIKHYPFNIRTFPLERKRYYPFIFIKNQILKYNYYIMADYPWNDSHDYIKFSIMNQYNWPNSVDLLNFYNYLANNKKEYINSEYTSKFNYNKKYWKCIYKYKNIYINIVEKDTFRIIMEVLSIIINWIQNKIEK
jgi:hypothetical protein